MNCGPVMSIKQIKAVWRAVEEVASWSGEDADALGRQMYGSLFAVLRPPIQMAHVSDQEIKTIKDEWNKQFRGPTVPRILTSQQTTLVFGADTDCFPQGFIDYMNRALPEPEETLDDSIEQLLAPLCAQEVPAANISIMGIPTPFPKKWFVEEDPDFGGGAIRNG